MIKLIYKIGNWFHVHFEDFTKPFVVTWKELSAKIEEIESKEDSSASGSIGQILNSLNPSYNQMVGGGFPV